MNRRMHTIHYVVLAVWFPYTWPILSPKGQANPSTTLYIRGGFSNIMTIGPVGHGCGEACLEGVEGVHLDLHAHEANPHTHVITTMTQDVEYHNLHESPRIRDH